MNRGGEKECGKKRDGQDRALFFVELSRVKGDPFVREVYGCVEKGVKGHGRRPLFLVGGAVRNLFLKKPLPLDFDFVYGGEVEGLARRVALKLKGAAFLLDKKEGLYRVALKENKALRTIDIAPLRHRDISEDLRARDFTVNAVALDLEALFEGRGEGVGTPVIDPCGGIDDCRRGTLRAVAPEVFDADPLRSLRGVRIARQYALEMTAGTRELIKEKSRLLLEKKTAPERIRDELLLIFRNSGSSRALGDLYALNIIKAVLPEAGGWPDVDGYGLADHAMKTVSEAERLLERIEEGRGGFPAEVKRYFKGSAGMADNATLLKLAAFLHDCGKPLTMAREQGRLRFIGHDEKGESLTRDILKRLKMSRRVASTVTGLVRNHHRVFTLAALKVRSERAKAHFFRAAGGPGGGDGLALLLLALADARATRGGEDAELAGLTREMLSFYSGVYVKKRPRPLMNGREIMEIFSLSEGRLVGNVIKKISEGVEAGVITNKKEAMEYIRGWLKERKG
ncbi:MAG: HD domain-containing protein [Thermodesulfobacteriota bacterium]